MKQNNISKKCIKETSTKPTFSEFDGYKIKHSSEFTNLPPTLTYRHKKNSYINIPCACDIETTSTYINGEKVAFPYLFMFGIGDSIYYARTPTEFVTLLNTISAYIDVIFGDSMVICLVHNLSFEFCFFSNWLEFTNVFSIDVKKPIRAVYKKIDFRCSYKLTNMSLATLSQKYGLRGKLVGDLDYSVYRDCDTVLSEKEWGYALRDVSILMDYWSNVIVKDYIRGKSNVWLPSTSTGIVRKNCKDRIPRGKKREYEFFCENLFPTKEMYEIMRKCFWGAIVHANFLHTGRVLKNVDSLDYTSDYPAVMLCEKYPMTRFVKARTIDFEKYPDNEYAKMIFVVIENFESKNSNRILSFSKLEKYSQDDIELDNGRVIRAKMVAFWCTELDLQVIKRAYSGKLTIKEMYISKKAYLPKFIIEAVVEFYSNKSKLKNVKGKEELYQKSKNLLNSLYGMMVTALCQSLIEWNGKDFYESEQEFHYSHEFLAYQWGVWVTAYARYNLCECLLSIDKDAVYYDTDSIKLLNYNKWKFIFDEQNEKIRNKVKLACDHFNIDENNVRGIGEWEHETKEKPYDTFITWGAKRYMHDSDITIAGIRGQAIIDYANHIGIPVIDFFKPPMHIPSEFTGKNTIAYTYGEKNFTIVSQKTKTKINIHNFIHVEPQAYDMTISKDYSTLLKNLQLIYDTDFRTRKGVI